MHHRYPVTQLMQVLRLGRSIVNYMRFARFRRIEDGYAVLTDPGHDYAVLHHYIDRKLQQQQLEDAGFRLLSIFDSGGRRIGPDYDDSLQTSLLYVAESRLDD